MALYICPTCGVEFKRKQRTKVARYCSRKCIQYPTGEQHHAWRGDAAATQTKRYRAVRRYRLGSCEKCGKPATDRHHKDGDTGNNARSNIALLCRRCHMIEDGRLEQFRAAAPHPVKTHCHRGHPLSGDNLYVTPDGTRRNCRACCRISNKKRRQPDTFAAA